MTAKEIVELLSQEFPLLKWTREHAHDAGLSEVTVYKINRLRGYTIKITFRSPDCKHDAVAFRCFFRTSPNKRRKRR